MREKFSRKNEPVSCKLPLRNKINNNNTVNLINVYVDIFKVKGSYNFINKLNT